jgi:hypothetical protein
MSNPMNDSPQPNCQLRVASRGEESIIAYVRHQRLEIGQALSFDEKYPGITALEAFVSAFAADIVNGMRVRARKQRLDISQMEGVVKVWLENPLAFLEVVGEQGTPAIQAIRLRLYVSTLETEDLIKVLLDQTLISSPLYLTLSKAAEVHVDFEIAI